MSDGSYDYLCFKDEVDIINSTNTIDNMAKRLIELGFEDLAKQTLNVLYEIKRYKLGMQVQLEKLSPVWKAVEWLDSGDTGLEDTIKGLKEYRQE